ncbi:MAG: hypothetical protein ACREGD_05085, partial [Candidatus Saccharimonadales bacterium]
LAEQHIHVKYDIRIYMTTPIALCYNFSLASSGLLIFARGRSVWLNERAASVLSRDDLNQLAAKTDIAELRADLIKWMAGLIIGSVVAMTSISAALVRLMIPA